MIEHATDPDQVTSEVTRVLNEDGILLLSTHTIAPVHNYPSDYWRWTDQGLRKMLTGHFSDITVHEVTTPVETMFHLASIYAPTKRFSSIYFAVINNLAQVFGKNSVNTRLPKLISLYLVVAQKNKISNAPFPDFSEHLSIKEPPMPNPYIHGRNLTEKTQEILQHRPMKTILSTQNENTSHQGRISRDYHRRIFEPAWPRVQ